MRSRSTDRGLRPQIVVERTGVIDLILQAIETVSPGGIVCLTGIGSGAEPSTASGAALATDVVLKNIAVFGSVNANRRHDYRAATALASADPSWLEQLVTGAAPGCPPPGATASSRRYQGRHGVRATLRRPSGVRSTGSRWMTLPLPSRPRRCRDRWQFRAAELTEVRLPELALGCAGLRHRVPTSWRVRTGRGAEVRATVSRTSVIIPRAQR